MGGSPPLILPITVSTGLSGGEEELEAPLLDFVEIARALEGEVLLPGQLPGPLGRFQDEARRLGYWDLAWRARRADPPLVVSLSEKIGMCVSFLNRHESGQLLIAHNLTTSRRRALQERTGWLQKVDRVLVLARPQEKYLLEEVKLETGRVRLIHDKVDHRFYAPQGDAEEGYVLSVGQTGRDYRTLLEAVGTASIETVLVPSSNWLIPSNGWMWGAEYPTDRMPSHVTVRQRISSIALRQLYDRASVVVVPLEPGLQSAAGVNGVLEAMAMRKPLIVSATPGLESYVADGQNALIVPPCDPLALRAAITTLLTDRGAAQRLATAGHALVQAGRNLDGYVANVTSIASELLVQK